MITGNDINELFNLFSSKKISKKEFTDKLLRIIIENRFFFSLERLNDDSLFDFLYFCFPKITECIHEFDDSKSSFASFYQMHIRMEYLNWKKARMKENLKNRAVLNINKHDYSSVEEYYYSASEDNVTYGNASNSVAKMLSHKKGKKELYVIILKSIDYLTSAQISSLVDYYELDFNELGMYLEEAKECIKIKKENILKMQELVHKDFFRREELRLGLTQFETDTPLYCQFYEDYVKICRRYQSRKNRLAKMKAIPSDNEIAKILNISPSCVRYILRKYYSMLNIDKK